MQRQNTRVSGSRLLMPETLVWQKTIELTMNIKWNLPDNTLSIKLIVFFNHGEQQGTNELPLT